MLYEVSGSGSKILLNEEMGLRGGDVPSRGETKVSYSWSITFK